MRLGCTIYRAETEAELEPLAEKFDCYGLSALVAPRRLEEFTEDEAASYGEKAASLGFVIGEAGFWENLLTPDAELRQDRIRRLQKIMRLAEIMGARSTNTLVFSRMRGILPRNANASSGKSC
jgi:sugar phosphate isomerase/epimerase